LYLSVKKVKYKNTTLSEQLQKYNTVGTAPKSNRKSQKEEKSIPLTHNFMTSHFPDKWIDIQLIEDRVLR